jgi:hypothetical protein
VFGSAFDKSFSPGDPLLPSVAVVISKRRRQQPPAGSTRQGIATGVHNKTQPGLTGEPGNPLPSKHGNGVAA